VKITDEQLEKLCKEIPNDQELRCPFLLSNITDEDFRVWGYGKPTLKDLVVRLSKKTDVVELTQEQQDFLTATIIVKIQFIEDFVDET